MTKYIIAFLLLYSTVAIADCLHLDAHTPHKTVAGLHGSCDAALTPTEITQLDADRAAAIAVRAAIPAPPVPVSCTGAPTHLYKVVNGIVTHC